MLSRTLSLSLSLLLASSVTAAEWKPAKGPLATRWAAKVSPQTALGEYPRPQLVRKEWLSLNGLWGLEIGKELAETILVPFPIESALSGVMKRCEKAWYRRTFDVPKEWAGNRILLHFEAVDWEATVLVNGKELGKHRGGYDSFSFDITDALKSAGPQELVVGVDGQGRPASRKAGEQSGRHLLHSRHRHLADGLARAGVGGAYL
jgi:hypothetical protein